jgi:endoribonuclease Nob1
LGSSVYDASAFYAGVPFASSEQGFTTSLVFDEIKHIKKSHGAIDILLQTDRLRIIDADVEKIKSITDTSKKTGDFQHLSDADISAVALALQIDGHLVTDDFAVSNLARNLGITVHPVMTKGIRDVGRWSYYCAACKKQFTAKSVCPICGSGLRKKLLKSESS